MKLIIRKRIGAPNLLWGLFILCAAYCFAEDYEAAGGGGVLLYRDDGQIAFGSGSISYGNGQNFENRLYFIGAGSSMPWFSTEFLGIDYSAGLSFGPTRPKLAAGFCASTGIEVLSGEKLLKNSGLTGFYVGSAAGFDAGKIEITPSFIFARMKFKEGDFYEFYGKPDINIIHAGLSAEYKKTHKAGFTYQNLTADILSNENAPLFQSDNHCVGVHYKYSLLSTRTPLSFYAVTGANYADFSAAGALTAENQQYFLFPYAFYNVNGKAGAFAGWVMFSLDIAGKYASHKIQAGAVNIFGGELTADTHYRYRKFFGDGEAAESMDKINLAGTGAALGAYSIESRKWEIGGKAAISLQAQKLFGYWWGTDKFTLEKPRPPTDDSWGMVKTILFSGLSGHFSLVSIR